MIESKFGSIISSLRKEMNLTQKDLADKLGISDKAVSRWETGKSYPTLDEGIMGFIDNLSKNYYAYGLTTVEAMAPKYAESATWPMKINAYVEKIRAS